MDILGNPTRSTRSFFSDIRSKHMGSCPATYFSINNSLGTLTPHPHGPTPGNKNIGHLRFCIHICSRFSVNSCDYIHVSVCTIDTEEAQAQTDHISSANYSLRNLKIYYNVCTEYLGHVTLNRSILYHNITSIID